MERELLQNFLQELKRGSLTLAVLLVNRGASYGYSLVQQLQERGLEVEQNTLYPCFAGWKARGSWEASQTRPAD